jgi:hypothetical protein
MHVMSAEPIVEPTERVRTFLHAVRNRFWLAAGLTGARLPLWSLAVTMLILAITHVRVAPVTPLVIASLILVFLAVLLVRIVVRRPSLAASAVLADRFFGGRSLLTTACECYERGAADRTVASEIVMRQAADASSRWAVRLDRITGRDRVPDLVVPLALAAIGFVLLALPGADEVATHPAPAAASRQEPVGDTAPAAQPEVARLLADALLADESDAATSARRHVGREPERSRSPGGSPGQLSADETRVAEGSLHNPLAGGPGAGEQAGQGRPGDPQGVDTTDPATAFAGREAIRIARTAAPSASGLGGAGPYADDGVTGPGSTAPVAAAARPPGDYGFEPVTSAQSAYAARYMQQTGQGNEEGH